MIMMCCSYPVKFLVETTSIADCFTVGWVASPQGGGRRLTVGTNLASFLGCVLQETTARTRRNQLSLVMGKDVN